MNIVSDDVIRDYISTGKTTGERLDLFFNLMRDMGIKDTRNFNYMLGQVGLTCFCLVHPTDKAQLDEWVLAMGHTCQIAEIIDTGEYSSTYPTAKLYNIKLIRPESPCYQLIWSISDNDKST